MKCYGLNEQEPSGGKCWNVMDHGKVFMQDSENGSKWACKGMFHMLFSDADMENLSIDSTIVKVHQSTNSSPEKGANQKQLVEQEVD